MWPRVRVYRCRWSPVLRVLYCTVKTEAASFGTYSTVGMTVQLKTLALDVVLCAVCGTPHGHALTALLASPCQLPIVLVV